MEKYIELLSKEWATLLEPILKSDYFAKVGAEVNQGKFSSKIIYPKKENIFNAFKLCPLSNLKVVILGNEPEQDENHLGLSWGGVDYLNMPEHLHTIFKEVESDIYDGCKLDQDPNLTRWAEQGVLLLNRSLTVQKKGYKAHIPMWDKFIKYVFTRLAQEHAGIVYVFWGKEFKPYVDLVDKDTNIVLKAHSPLPGYEGFSGCRHFSKINEVLTEVAKGKEKKVEDYLIKW